MTPYFWAETSDLPVGLHLLVLVQIISSLLQDWVDHAELFPKASLLSCLLPRYWGSTVLSLFSWHKVFHCSCFLITTAGESSDSEIRITNIKAGFSGVDEWRGSLYCSRY